MESYEGNKVKWLSLPPIASLHWGLFTLNPSDFELPTKSYICDCLKEVRTQVTVQGSRKFKVNAFNLAPPIYN